MTWKDVVNNLVDKAFIAYLFTLIVTITSRWLIATHQPGIVAVPIPELFNQEEEDDEDYEEY